MTEQEAEVFDARARTDSVVGTQMRLAMGERTVKRRCQSIAKKLARCGHHGHMSACIEERLKAN